MYTNYAHLCAYAAPGPKSLSEYRLMKRTVRIVYTNYAGRQFEHPFTGTEEEIQAEIDRMLSLPDVKDCWAE